MTTSINKDQLLEYEEEVIGEVMAAIVTGMAGYSLEYLQFEYCSKSPEEVWADFKHTRKAQKKIDLFATNYKDAISAAAMKH